MQNIKQSFIFYASFYDAIECLSDKKRLKMYDAIAKLALKNEETELKGEEKRLFCLIRPQILANLKRYEDGQKGGRPKKEKVEEIKTTGFENKKPNENENVNNNENVNINVNGLGFQKKEKIDPYINPINDYFCKEYQKVFNVKPHLLLNQRNKLAELASELDNFKETLPTVLNKLKTIEFDLPNFNANYLWLLKDDNYIKVLSGTYDKRVTGAEQFLSCEVDEYGN